MIEVAAKHLPLCLLEECLVAIILDGHSCIHYYFDELIVAITLGIIMLGLVYIQQRFIPH